MVEMDLVPGDPFNIEAHPNVDSWLKGRLEGIGGSDSAALFGCNPYKSLFELWSEKSGLIESSFAESEAMFWGKELEEPIARRYARETGRGLRDHGRFTIFRSQARPHLFCTPDRQILGDDRGPGSLSIKNVNRFKADDWLEEAPDYYAIQLQHELAVTGWSWGSFGVLIGGNEFRWMDVPRNEPFITLLCERADAFWDRVRTGDPPPVDGSERTTDALNRLYPSASGDIKVLNDEAWLEVDAELTSAKDLVKRHGKRVRELENLFKSAIGASPTVQLADGTLYHWNTIERSGYEVKPTTYRSLTRRGK